MEWLALVRLTPAKIHVGREVEVEGGSGGRKWKVEVEGVL